LLVLISLYATKNSSGGKICHFLTNYWYSTFCTDKTFDVKPQQPHNRLLTSIELSRLFNPR